MPARRAKVVSLKDLSKSIDNAVALATKRHGIETEGNNVILNWILVGRILRAKADAGVAMAAAITISKAVKVPGITPQPTLSKVGGNILVGFIAKGQLAELGR